MSKMADDDPWLLKEDGYLNVDIECKSIIYHANLNVLLITTGSAQVYVFDVNSGVILQKSSLSGKHFYSFTLHKEVFNIDNKSFYYKSYR